MQEGGPNPAHIMQVGMGFMASKTLLSAVDLELFTVLSQGGLTAAQIGERLSLHPRSTRDFLDALVSLHLIERDGSGTSATYRNTEDTSIFLDKNKPSYMGGILEMCNNRLYPFWSDLTTALRTGEPQNEAASGGEQFFEVLYSDEARLEEFLHAMAGFQMGNFIALAQKFDWSKFATHLDAGGANGALSVSVARANPHMSCTSFDLPPVKPLAERFVEANGLSERVTCVAGDFFANDFPKADVVTMGNILHDWNEEQKLALMTKAYNAVNDGGAFIAIELVIDNERRQNTMGLLMSLNMLIETPGGFDYTGAQFDGWAKKVGFSRTEFMPLAGPVSAAIAWK